MIEVKSVGDFTEITHYFIIKTYNCIWIAGNIQHEKAEKECVQFQEA